MVCVGISLFKYACFVLVFFRCRNTFPFSIVECDYHYILSYLNFNIKCQNCLFFPVFLKFKCLWGMVYRMQLAVALLYIVNCI